MLLWHQWLVEFPMNGTSALLWRHKGGECVSNHQPHDCLLSRLLGRWSQKTSKLRVAGLCAGNSSETGEFPVQMASNAENVSISWRHHLLACRVWSHVLAFVTHEISSRRPYVACRQISNIRRTKSPNINVSRLVMQSSLPNPLKKGVKLRMKM